MSSFNLKEIAHALITRYRQSPDGLRLKGVYHAQIVDRDGNVKFEGKAENTVVTVGRNILLNTLFAGSSYSVTGPYMGLISSVSWSAIASSDTMASHSGWLEAGSTNAPTYSGSRGTVSWASASGGDISTSAAVSFAITGSGTVEGFFIVLGSGAVNTVMNTAGTLFSAAQFSSGAATVANGDTLNVTYTLNTA